MIPLLLLFLVGSCHTMNPSHKTANASLLNLCLHESPYCTELGPDETCNSRGSEQIQRYNTEICQVNNHPLTDVRLQASNCEFTTVTGPSELEGLCPGTDECVHQSQWLSLSHSLIHYHSDRLGDTFNVSIHWELPPGVSVSGYSLTVSLGEWSCPVDSKLHLQCGTTELTADSNDFMYTHTRGYSLDEELQDGFLYIKLIPHGWCNGSQLKLIIPETCHSICPGACSVCKGYKSPIPTNVSVSLCRSPNTDMGVATIAWQRGRMYFEAYPNQTYYLALFRDTDTPISRHIEIVGQTQVTLHNLRLVHNQTYIVKVWSFDCQCSFFPAKAEFSMSNTTPHCPNPVTTSASLHTSHTPSHHIRSMTITHFTPSLSTYIPSLTPLPTSIPSLPPPISLHHWLYSLLVFIIAVTIILITIGIFIYRLRHTEEFTIPDHKISSSPSPQPLTAQVLLVYSLKTPTEEIENILINFAAPLQFHGIEVIFYDTVSGRTGLPQWMEGAVNKCSKVFLVCNEQFKTEWENLSSDSFISLEGNLVHILKQNFFAHVQTSSDYMSKYALLFMGSGERYIVSSYLHNLKKFVVDPGNPSALEEVARFITNTKSYVLDIGV